MTLPGLGILAVTGCSSIQAQLTNSKPHAGVATYMEQSQENPPAADSDPDQGTNGFINNSFRQSTIQTSTDHFLSV